MQSEKGKELAPEIIFEDDSLLVINKPSGWVVNEANTVKHKKIIQKWIIANIKSKIVKDYEYRCGIVHRLDKGTSGVLIIAKDKDSFENLQRQFKERKVKKTYLALVHGKMLEKKGEIEATVGRLPWRRDRFGVISGGRESKTLYKPLKEYKKDGEDFTLVEFKPVTGRTHQIRIHAKHIHHPLVADDFYAGRKRSRADSKWCPRLFLHAAKISFLHPKTGKRVEYEAPLPDDLKAALSSLH